MVKVLVASLSLVLCVTSAACRQPSDPWIGTWKLSVAKSKELADPARPWPQNNTLRVEPVPGGGHKHTVEGVNAVGQRVYSERVTKYDGRDVPVEALAPPMETEVSFTNDIRRLDPHSYEVTVKADGTEQFRIRVVVSPDGQTMTQTISATDATGQPLSFTEIYEKQ
jgi:hypothetical protein